MQKKLDYAEHEILAVKAKCKVKVAAEKENYEIIEKEGFNLKDTIEN